MNSVSSQKDSEDLREAGLHVTAQRLAVYRAVKSFQHALAEEVCEHVCSEIGAISRQAVYDALNAMTEHGLLRRIQPAGTTARYEHKLDNHHHLVCRCCGVMMDTECGSEVAPCLHAKNPCGFVIDEAEVIYWGTCPECQQNKIS